MGWPAVTIMKIHGVGDNTEHQLDGHSDVVRRRPELRRNLDEQDFQR